MEKIKQIFIVPGKFFDVNPEEEDVGFVIPMLVQIVVAMLVFVLFAVLMDPDQIRQEAIAEFDAALEMQAEMMRSQGLSDNVIDENLETSRRVGLPMVEQGASPMMTIVYGVLSVVIGYWLVVLLYATYLKLSAVGRVAFPDLLALIWWARMPLIVGSLVTMFGMLIIGVDTQDVTNYSILSPALWFGVEASSNPILGQMIDSIRFSLDLPLIWALVIMTIGYSKWTDRDIPVSAVIVFAPYVVIYGLAYFL